MNLLIVDDHDANLRLLRAQLEGEGHAVVAASNGIEALDAMATADFDGVISDILMPRMDGYRLCLEIRKDARYAQLPCILYTSTYNSAADRDLARAAGADAYIEKPAPTRVLLDALAAAANLDRSGRDRGSHPDLETPVLKQYSETLVRKLEAKSLELAQANAGLLQVEARLSGLVESAMDAIIAVDERQRVVLFNGAAGRMFGRTPEAALGQPLGGLIPLRYRALHEAHVERFAHETTRAKPMVPRIVSGLRADGTEFPVEASISKLFTSQGMIYTVFVRDVTDRQLAEQAIAQNEAVLRRAQKLAQLAHVITRTDGGFESWSETLPPMLGLTPKASPRDFAEWLQLVHPEDRDACEKGVTRAMRLGKRAEIEYRMRCRDGWIDVHQVLEPLPDALVSESAAPRWFNTLQNITDQKRAQARIYRLNRVHAMLSGITSLIVHTQDRAELFRESCRIAVDAGRFSDAWIAVRDPESGDVRVAAASTPDSTFMRSLPASFADVDSPQSRLFGSALAGAQPVYFHEAHPGMPPGIHSVAVLPLVIEGRTLGALFLHAVAADIFDHEETELLHGLAGDISFALDHIQKSERLQYLGNYDVLTGTPNRQLFVDRLRQMITVPQAREALFAVVLMDVERFRRVNETLGRGLGDRLLQMVAARLAQCNASVARVGTDLFALEIHDRLSATEIARAIEDMAGQCFGSAFELSGEEWRIGCRSGVAVFPTDGLDAETLLHNAEAALRQAKHALKSLVFYAPEMNASAAQSLALESRLRRAIEHEEFVLHYQPKIDMRSRNLAGVEALLRWQDPLRGMVAPGEFISILEESGLIGTVGEWALSQAMADHRRWRDAGLGSVRVAVNVSPLQLNNPGFADVIGQVVRAEGGHALELEITESVIMDNLDRNIAMLKTIREFGVNVAIDDFGTGYSSLAYIAKLPVCSVKIDRSFINGMSESREGLAIVSSIIALAHALRLTVVAEGVETEEQARLLGVLLCDEAQGYLYGRPVSAGAIADLLGPGGMFSTE